jgi:uncharacterized damage-inducible protein DinB
MESLRYPIGRFDPHATVAPAERAGLIDSIATAPARLRAAVAGLNDSQLDTPYRDTGWTVRQVVHHVPDSHLNAYIRFRWALTEATPTIKPYNEKAWAELRDAATAPVEVSLDLLEALHARWVLLLRSLSESDFERTFQHPESGTMTIGTLLRLYEWHGRHHVAHITNLRSRQGWS